MKSNYTQPRHVFFNDPNVPDTVESRIPAPTLEQILFKFSVEAPRPYFSNIVGQDIAKRKLRRAAVNALQKWDHNCCEYSFLITGPSSVGKTTLVKAFAGIVNLPFVEVSPRSVQTMDDLFNLIHHALAQCNPPLPLMPIKRANNYELPPCIIFIDEAHALRKGIQNDLLKAIEADDRQFTTEAGENVSTANVCWFFATTEVGDLFGPLLNRFTEINLKPYNREEIAEIVRKKYPVLDIETCRDIAHYESRVPRRAISFANELLQEAQQRPGIDLCYLIKEIAEENEIDEYGMHKRHLHILRLLAEKPVSKDRLALSLQVGKEELERLIMPPIMLSTVDNPSLVTVCQAGYTLTEHGLQELMKRGMLSADYVFKPQE